MGHIDPHLDFLILENYTVTPKHLAIYRCVLFFPFTVHVEIFMVDKFLQVGLGLHALLEIKLNTKLCV